MPDVRIVLLLLVAVMMATLLTAPTASGPRIVTSRGLLWHADADVDVDAGVRTRFWGRKVGPDDRARLSIVDDPTGQHGRVYRAHLTSAEIEAGDTRAEFAEARLGDGEDGLKLGVAGTQDVWFGWRSLFGGDVVIDRGHANDGNYMQLKGDSSCGGPVLGLTIKYGRLTLRSERYLPDTDGVAWNGPSMSSLLDGSWHDFTVHVRFSKDSSGYVELWFDGQRQTMVNGATRINLPTMCPNDTYVFPKLGVYAMDRGTGDGPIHWIESPRIGGSHWSVAPR